MNDNTLLVQFSSTRPLLVQSLDKGAGRSLVAGHPVVEDLPTVDDHTLLVQSLSSTTRPVTRLVQTLQPGYWLPSCWTPPYSGSPHTTPLLIQSLHQSRRCRLVAGYPVVEDLPTVDDHTLAAAVLCVPVRGGHRGVGAANADALVRTLGWM